MLVEEALKSLLKKGKKYRFLLSSALALARDGKSTVFITLDSEIILFKDDIEKLENGGKLGIINGYKKKEFPN